MHYCNNSFSDANKNEDNNQSMNKEQKAISIEVEHVNLFIYWL